MERLTKWTAKRAGAGITITALGSDGQQRRVANIASVEGANPYPIATDKDGVKYELAT